MEVPAIRLNDDTVEVLGVLLTHKETGRKVHVIGAPYVATPDYWLRVFDNMGIMQAQGWIAYLQHTTPSNHGLSWRDRVVLRCASVADRVASARARRMGLMSFDDRKMMALLERKSWIQMINTERSDLAATFVGSASLFVARTFFSIAILALAPKNIVLSLLTHHSASSSRSGLHPEYLHQRQATMLVNDCLHKQANAYMVVNVACMAAIIRGLREHGFVATSESVYWEAAFPAV